MKWKVMGKVCFVCYGVLGLGYGFDFREASVGSASHLPFLDVNAKVE